MAYAEAFYPSGDGTSTSNGNVRVRCDAWAEKAESTTGKVTVYNSLQLWNIYNYSGSYYTSGTSIASQIRANSSSSTTEVTRDLGSAFTISDWTTLVRSSITVNVAVNGTATFQVSGRTYGSPTIGEFNLSWYNVTLYDVLVAVHTVSFNLGGAPGTTPSNVTKKRGTAFSMPNDPIWSGHKFLGWKSNISGDGSTRYGKASGLSNYTHDQYGSTVTLTAQWQTLEYTISYNANGGTGAPASQTKTANVDLTLSSQTPTWAGHTFKNWNTAQNGTGSVYLAGGTYSANAAATLYAQWDLDPYIITFNANGGLEPPGPSSKMPGETLRLPMDTPYRTGYTFFRWNTSSDGTGQDYSPGGKFNIDAHTTLYAIWIENQIPIDLVHDCYLNSYGNWIPCIAYINASDTWYIVKKTAIKVSNAWKNASDKI
jgi:uncharacterized repeat protein (TIGR02543 family)